MPTDPSGLDSPSLRLFLGEINCKNDYLFSSVFCKISSTMPSNHLFVYVFYLFVELYVEREIQLAFSCHVIIFHNIL